MIDAVKYLELRCSFSEHGQETVKKKLMFVKVMYTLYSWWRGNGGHSQALSLWFSILYGPEYSLCTDVPPPSKKNRDVCTQAILNTVISERIFHF